MGKITIVNIRISDEINDAQRFYCGRGTALGNPFNMQRNESNRDHVCDQYQEHFDIAVNPLNTSPVALKMKDQLSRITEGARAGNIELGCFCAPKRCHCETIKDYVETML